MSTKSPRCVFVGNLDRKVNEKELKDIFSECGRVERAEIVSRNGKPMGFGYVTYYSAEDTQKAYHKMHEKCINGKYINVEMSVRDEDSKPEPTKSNHRSERKRHHEHRKHHKANDSESSEESSDSNDEKPKHRSSSKKSHRVHRKRPIEHDSSESESSDEVESKSSDRKSKSRKHSRKNKD